jgi:hypothetical protein
LDDDAEQLRDFGMDANWPHKKVALDLSAAEFSRIGWITSLLGPQAVIHPRQLQHARAAIQFLFCTIQTEHILNDLGSTLFPFGDAGSDYPAAAGCCLPCSLGKG